jgi:GTP-binding protein LepA
LKILFTLPVKTGFGVENILAAITEKIPPPSGNVDEPLQALILTHYNPFQWN